MGTGVDDLTVGRVGTDVASVPGVLSLPDQVAARVDGESDLGGGTVGEGIALQLVTGRDLTSSAKLVVETTVEEVEG